MSIEHITETTCPRCLMPYAIHEGDEVTTVCPNILKKMETAPTWPPVSLHQGGPVSDENVERARALALEFDLTYLRERNTCASEAEARTAGWLAVARASRPREAGSGETKPEVVCLCGSTRFIETFQAEYGRLTDEGKIVLTVGRVVPQSEQALGSTRKVALDALHLRKIDLADRVLVLNVGGYVGPSTRREIAYAKECGKPIDLLYPDAGLDGLPPPLAPEACPVAWQVVSTHDGYSWGVFDRSNGGEQKAAEFARRGPHRVVPLCAQPASATAEGVERKRGLLDVTVKPRRPYDEDHPDGYLESDNDFIANNHDAAILLLEAYATPAASAAGREGAVEKCARVLCDEVTYALGVARVTMDEATVLDKYAALIRARDKCRALLAAEAEGGGQT